MKTYPKISATALGVLLFALLCLPGLLLAQDVDLAWDPSESTNVAGYRIYYKADSTELPLDGIEALQGPSPIDVGNVTSFTLSELPEGFVYYFRATAYDSEGNESSFSNLAASEWIPAPISPERGRSAGTPATLVWSAAPQDRNLTFTVRYGTKSSLRSALTPPIAGNGNAAQPEMPSTATLFAILVCLLSMGVRPFTGKLGKKRLLALGLCLGLALSTASCGGGGGGGGDSAPASLSQDNDTVTVSGLTDNYLVTEELEEGTTYYWQVIAEDDNGQEYESEISSFIAG